MPKWVKMIVALALLPACVGAAKALWRVLQYTGAADTTWAPMLAGAACWLVIFLILPKPMWIYVVGHEFTHAMWTWIFGGKVKRFKATSSGGKVVITKSNFIITLAPYFFPIYAALVVVGFLVGDLMWGWSRHRVWFHLFLGAAYAFHLTLTAHTLKTRQPDITSQGYLFSAVIIYLGNILVALIGLPLLTGLNLLTVAEWWLRGTADVIHWIR